jgi:hypothetical protein
MSAWLEVALRVLKPRASQPCAVIGHLQTLAIAVSEEYVETMDGRRLGPFDSMVLSTGTTAETTPEGVIPIGDCVAPRGVWAAVGDAHVAALNL